MMNKPSFYALFLTGILSFIVILLLLSNFSNIMRLGVKQKIAVVSLAGALLGIHGLLHLGMESVYNYNPIERMF